MSLHYNNIFASIRFNIIFYETVNWSHITKILGATKVTVAATPTAAVENPSYCGRRLTIKDDQATTMTVCCK